jgi:hypothetical protein
MTTIQTRTPYKLSGPGPYIAVVQNNLDPNYMGGLMVSLIKGYFGNVATNSSAGIYVRYMSPFFGSTPIEYQGTDPKNPQDTQRSYGMWMVPPDIGTHVMVIFVDGDYNQGYWIGCVPDKLQNQMVPGIGAVTLNSTDLSSEQLSKYGTTTLPVTEGLKIDGNNPNSKNSARTLPPPVHPFASRLAAQGLLKDPIRGTTTSSARRESPSQVYGISTPGPLDPNGKIGKIKYDETATSVPVNRLGGHTFVMDDGDKNGDNALVRIRTRTGHQILMHDTKKLIYIANGEGTAWIEMTEQGKIDIYAQSSVSIHTEADFNFQAGRDVNIEANNNVNIHAFNNINLQADKNVNLKALESLTAYSVKDMYLASDAKFNLVAEQVGMSAATSFDVLGESIHLLGSQSIDMIGSNNIRAYAKKVQTQTKDVKGPSSSPKYNVPSSFIIRSVASTLGVGQVTNGTYPTGSLSTFINRVPMHEPWPQHESTSPLAYTDIDIGVSPNSGANGAARSDAVLQDLPDDAKEIEKDIEGSLADAENAGAIYFTSNSGDKAHFLKIQPRLQAAIIAAAIYYKKNYKKSIVITSSYRDKDEQRKLYQAWLRGEPGIYTPVNPDDPTGWPNSHSKGLAVDMPPNIASDLYDKGILQKYKLTWGGTFNKPDQVHAQM